MPKLSGKNPGYFYRSILSEFIKIAQCTLKFSTFVPNAKQLFLRTMNYGVNQVTSLKQIK